MLITPQFIAIVGLLLGTASAVDLRQYATSRCNGSNRSVCRDIGSNKCCRRPSGSTLHFKSGSCKAKVSTLRHSVHRGPSSNRCRNRYLDNSCGSDNCLNDPSASLTGHQWRRPSFKRGLSLDIVSEECEAGEEPEETGCTESVEPDLVIIDNRVFEVNGTIITKDQKKELWSLFDQYALMEQNDDTVLARSTLIPSEFEEFEITYED